MPIHWCTVLIYIHIYIFKCVHVLYLAINNNNKHNNWPGSRYLPTYCTVHMYIRDTPAETCFVLKAFCAWHWVLTSSAGAKERQKPKTRQGKTLPRTSAVGTIRHPPCAGAGETRPTAPLRSCMKWNCGVVMADCSHPIRIKQVPKTMEQWYVVYTYLLYVYVPYNAPSKHQCAYGRYPIQT